MIPLRDLCFSRSFERKSLKQLTAYDLVWGFVNESWKCTSLHVHYVPLYLWRKSRNIGSKHLEPEPGSKSRRSYFRIKVEILGDDDDYHYHDSTDSKMWQGSLPHKNHRNCCWNIIYIQGPCSGDSGGPLFSIGQKTEAGGLIGQELLGIHSGGLGCGLVQTPAWWQRVKQIK